MEEVVGWWMCLYPFLLFCNKKIADTCYIVGPEVEVKRFVCPPYFFLGYI